MRLLLAPLLLSLPTLAQTAQPTPVPLYDVVTIKPSQSIRDSSGIDANDSTLRAYNLTLKSLLEQAYNIRPDLISGIPADLATRRYDINAKILEPDFNVLEHLTDAQRRTQMLAILTDRFHLKAHIETRTSAHLRPHPPPPGPLKFAKATLKPDGTPDRSTNIRNRSLEARGVTLADFCATLTNQLHRTVIDATNLPRLLRLHPEMVPRRSRPRHRPQPTSPHRPPGAARPQTQVLQRPRPHPHRRPPRSTH